jgi:hypothetical protein
MLKIRHILTSIAFVLGCTLGAMADTVILKSGEKVEGKILEETDAQVTVQIKISSSITDERVVKRADIAKIDKVKPDEQAWPLVKSLALEEDSAELTEYQEKAARLNNFLSTYPTSSHADEAKAKLAQFEEERKRVAAGEMKLGGKWLSKTEVQEERGQIGGTILLKRMKRMAAAGQITEAMNVFDAMQKNYAGSFAMPEAIELGRQLTPQIKAAAEKQKERLKAQADENKRRLEVAQGQEREQLATMLRNRAAQEEAVLSAIEKSQVKWFPLTPSNERTLSALASRASSESSSLNSKPVDKMRQSIRATETARTAIAAKDTAATEKALSEAQSTWSENELAKRLKAQFTEERKSWPTVAALEEAARKKAAAEAAAKEAAKAKPTPAVASAPVVEETIKSREDPFYTKPIFWVALALIGGFGVLGMKALRKVQDPNKNILDQ